MTNHEKREEGGSKYLGIITVVLSGIEDEWVETLLIAY